ncbi:MAG: biotin/lipoyl-containing protein [Candidatus Kapaibacteriota bacterium]
MHIYFPNMTVSYHAEAEFLQEKKEFELIVEHFSVKIGEEIFTFEPISGYPALFRVTRNLSDDVRTIIAMQHEQGMEISLNGYSFIIDVHSSASHRFKKIISSGVGKYVSQVKVPASMPGLLKSVSVVAGQPIKKGDPLFVLEAMKMENVIKSPISGTVQMLFADTGVAIEKGFVLCTIDHVNKE